MRLHDHYHHAADDLTADHDNDHAHVWLLGHDHDAAGDHDDVARDAPADDDTAVYGPALHDATDNGAGHDHDDRTGLQPRWADDDNCGHDDDHGGRDDDDHRTGLEPGLADDHSCVDDHDDNAGTGLYRWR